MIDRFTVEGPLKAFEYSDIGRGSSIGFVTSSSTTLRASADFIDSPLSGAQMELKLQASGTEEHPTLNANLEIPLSSALIGSNWLHNNARQIGQESFIAGRLARLILETYEFRPNEVNRFIQNAVASELELTWHIATSSRSAAAKLQFRTYMFFKTLGLVTSRHDVGVAAYEWRDRSQRGCLLVTLKNGTKLRFYRKLDELEANHRTNKRGKPLNAAMAVPSTLLDRTIASHFRVEVIASRKHLQTLGMSHPSHWTKENIEALIKDAWKLACLDRPYKNNVKAAVLALADLSAEVVETATAYASGSSLGHLSDKTFSIHRQTLVEYGIDIAVPVQKHEHLTGSLGQQLSYANRFIPSTALQGYIVSPQTIAELSATLEEMIGLVREQHTTEELDARANARLARYMQSRRSRRPDSEPDAGVQQ
jgi:hypothetical protein